MSFGKIVLLGLIIWILLFFNKYLFFQILGFEALWQTWVYYLLIIFFARIISRRFGVINILEAAFAGLVWALIILLLDSLVAKSFLDEQVFRTLHYWLSYAVMFVAVFFLHKKRHIQVRKELLAKHGHH